MVRKRQQQRVDVCGNGTLGKESLRRMMAWATFSRRNVETNGWRINGMVVHRVIGWRADYCRSSQS